MRVFVTGATGFIGTALIPRLVTRGHQVVALVRAGSQPSALNGPGLRVVHGDLEGIAGLDLGLDGVDAAIHMAFESDSPGDPERCTRTNVAGTQRLTESCRSARVRRFIYLSTLTVTRRGLGNYGLTKLAAEEVVRASGLDFTIFRPCLVYGPGTRGVFPRLVRHLKSLPIVPILGPVTVPLKPIFIEDLIRMILSCLESDRGIGRTYDATGPDTVSFNKLLDLVSRELGVKRLKLHLPFRLALSLARAAESVFRNPPISVDNVLGMNHPPSAHPEPTWKELGLVPTRLYDGLHATFNRQ